MVADVVPVLVEMLMAVVAVVYVKVEMSVLLAVLIVLPRRSS